jgi:C4-dicarboxylate-specific signal transduction histidine kinase
MGQLGIAGATVVLWLALGRSYINSVASRVREVREQQQEALAKLEASWEARLADMRQRAEAWEAAANRREETGRELTAGLTRVESVMDQNIQLLRAIREGQKIT